MTEPTDVREMRRRITTAQRGDDDLNGEPIRGNRISTVGHVIRHMLILGEREGWSGEDTMTALAFYALRGWETATNNWIDSMMLSPSPPRVMLQENNTVHKTLLE